LNKSIRGKYAIVGVGNTPYGKVPGVSALRHNVDAIAAAIDDCGIDKSEVDAVLTKAPSSDFQMLWSARVAQSIGIVPKVTATLDQAGASNIGLVGYAIMCMEMGMCSAAVISYGDNPLTGKRAFYSRPRGEEAAYGFFGAPLAYAMAARRHMVEFGTTSEQLGHVAVNARANASLNPNAQFKDPITLEEHQASRFVAEPFHLLDCCPVSDGGAAIVVTSAERARDLKKKPAYVLGLGQGHPAWDLQHREAITTSGAAISGQMAFEMAGLGPRDMQFAQLYDCFTIVPLITLEDYGFCQKGEGGPFVATGSISRSGTIPLNTSGGLLAETGMPGMQLIAEGVRQLRGECGDRQVRDAAVGIVSGQGGIMTTHATMILGNQP
jgi:acetyl-CoA acetyltransferase